MSAAFKCLNLAAQYRKAAGEFQAAARQETDREDARPLWLERRWAHARALRCLEDAKHSTSPLEALAALETQMRG